MNIQELPACKSSWPIVQSDFSGERSDLTIQFFVWSVNTSRARLVGQEACWAQKSQWRARLTGQGEVAANQGITQINMESGRARVGQEGLGQWAPPRCWRKWGLSLWGT